MPVTLSIKKVPDEIAEALRSRADRNQLSLQEELMAIIEEASGRKAHPEPR
jgi:plasmid stability protein